MIKNKRFFALLLCMALIALSVAPALAMPDIVKVQRADGSIVQYSLNDAIASPALLSAMNADIATAFENGRSIIGTKTSGTVINVAGALESAGGYSAYESGVVAGTIGQGTDITPTLVATVDGGNVVENPYVAPEAVTITAITDKTIQIGNSYSFVPELTPDTATITTATSSDEAVVTATVLGNGITLNAVAAGTATITVTAAKTGYTSATTTFTVTVPGADEVATVSAVDGTVTVVMTTAPAVDPVVGDFTVTMAIDGAAATAVTPTAITWDAATKTAVLTVPTVTATAAVQSVVYSVAYKETPAKTAAAFEVVAAALVPTTVEVAAISVAENLTATPVVTVKDQAGTTMTEGFTLTYASSNLAVATVAADGTITAGAYSATANTATLTVTATPTTGTAVNGTATVTVTRDQTKPTITSVTAISGKQIQVVFSEKVDTTTAQTVTNYSLYSVTGNKLYSFVAANGSAGTGKVVGSAQLQADSKTVLLNLTNTSTNTGGYAAADEQAGFVLSGLTNADYILYVSSVTDKAATANTIVTNSNKQFTGTTTPDATAPTLLSASYDTGLKQLTLSFDEAPNSVDVSKMTFVNGTASVVLTGASSSNSTLTSVITLTTAQATSLGTLASGATIQLAAGAVTDASSNSNTAAQTVTVSAAVRPEVAASTYDEATSQLTLNFSMQIKTSTIDVTKMKLQWSTDGTNYTDLATLDTTNYTVGAAGSSAAALQFTLNQTAIDAVGAKRGTANVVYRVGLQDTAVTNAAGTLSNDTGSPGGSDWQYATLTYTKETSAPSIASANFYTTAKSTTPRYTGDTTGVQANHLYIVFDQKIRPASVTNDGNLTLEYGTTTPKTSVSLTTTSATVTTAATILSDGYTLDVVIAAGAGLNGIAAGNGEVKVTASSSLTDVNKNTVTAGTKAITYNNNAAAGSITATMHSATQIKLVQSTTNFGGTASASNFNVYTTTNINDTKSIKTVSMVDTDNNNVKDAIFIELNAAPTAAVTVAFTGLTDSIGQTITNGTASAGALTTDAAAPTLVSGASTFTDVDSSSSISAGDKVTLIFGEPVKAKTSPTIAPAYGNGATLTAGTNANEMVITIGSSPSITFGTTNIEGSSGDMITDTTGNAFNGSATAIPTATGATAPVFATGGAITATDVDANGKLSVGDKISIPFDKTLSTTPTIDVSKIAVERVGSANTAINAATTFTAAAVGTNVVLTFTAVNSADATDVSSAWSVTITGASSNIKSSWGVEIGNIAETYITANVLNKPYVTSATFNTNTKKLKVVFSEAVVLSNLGDVSLTDVFSLTSPYTMPDCAGTTAGTNFYLDTTDTSNKTVIFILATAAIDPGLVYLNAAAGGATDSGGVKDFDGNKIGRNDATGVLIAADSALSDTTAPTLSSVAATSVNAAGDTVAITFSEAMDVSTLTTSNLAARLTIEYDANNADDGDETGITLTNATGAWSNSNKTFTVTLNEATDGAYIPDAQYISVKTNAALRDVAGNAISAPTTAVYTSATIADEDIAPTISSVVGTSVNAGNDTIVITFNEGMTKTDITLAKIKNAQALEIGYADDAAGTSNYVAFTVTNLTSANWTGYNVLTITLDEATDGAYIPNGKYVIVKNGSVVTNTIDLNGNQIGTASAVIGATTAGVSKETTAPTLASWALGVNDFDAINDTIVLTFSENIALGDELAATGVSLAVMEDFLDIDTDGDGTAETLTSAGTPTFDFAISGTTLTITLKAATLTSGGLTSGTSTLTINDVSNITDLVGNAVTAPATPVTAD